MKNLYFLSKRNLKEMLRDPISLIFGLCVPVVFLVVMQLALGNAKGQGAEIFSIENFTPSTAVFGFSFTMLYVALMIATDKNSAFMSRLLVSPVKNHQYLLSYLPAALINSVLQIVLFYIVAFIFGLKLNLSTIISAIYLIVPATFFILMGILIGSIANSEKQAGPLSSIIISSAGILGGLWMPIKSIGGAFETICKILPFYNCVIPSQSAMEGNYLNLLPFVWVLLYSVAVAIASFIIFNKKTKN